MPDDHATSLAPEHQAFYERFKSFWSAPLTTYQNFPSNFIDRVTRRVIQRVRPNQRAEMVRNGWWDRGGCRVGLG
jgi:hypothetical protein